MEKEIRSTYLEASRVQSQSNSYCLATPTLVDVHPSPQNSSHNITLSCVMSDLNSLRNTVKYMQRELSALKDVAQPSRAVSTCHISVVCTVPCSASNLPSLIRCPALTASKVRAGLSWKVKIHRHHLYDALSSSCETHSVRVWGNNPLKLPQTFSKQPVSTNHNMASQATL